MNVRIKVCGIVHPDDAVMAVDAGVDLIGLNFVGRIGTEEEMGKLAVYMLSDDSGFMNGTDVVIDAGRLIGEN